MRDYKKIEEGIIKCLEDHGIYEDIDLLLVDDYIRSCITADNLWKHQQEHGEMVNIRKKESEEPYYQASQAVNLGLQASKNGSALLTKLGVTPQERAKLNIKKKAKKDELDDLLG